MTAEERREFELLRALLSEQEAQLATLRQRLSALEARLGSEAQAPASAPAAVPISAGDDPPPPPPPPPPQPKRPAFSREQALADLAKESAPRRTASPAVPKEALEVRVGTYWLPRAGTVLLTTGLVFLAGYVHQNLPKGAKVALLYVACAGLGALGLRLEKRYDAVGRALLACALAGVYFTTYALHYLPALHMLESGTVAAMLLFVWAAVMAAAAHWKRSEAMAGLAFFLGYYTAILPQMPWTIAGNDPTTPFSLVAAAILAGGVVALCLAHGWQWLTYGGVAATYAAYWFWFDATRTSFWLAAAFLALFWTLFTAAVVFGRPPKPAIRALNICGAVNNCAYFALMTIALAANFPPESGHYWRFPALLGGALLALAWHLRGGHAPARLSFEAYGVQGFLLLGVAILSKWSGYEQAIALSAQAVVLLVLGCKLEWRAARGVAHLLVAIALLYEWLRGLLPQAAPIAIGDWAAPSGPLVALATIAVAATSMAWIARAWRQTRSASTGAPLVLGSPLYLAIAGASAAALAAHRECSTEHLPGIAAAISIALRAIGALGRKSEILLAAQIPLLLGQVTLLANWSQPGSPEIPLWGAAACIAYTYLLAAASAMRSRTLAPAQTAQRVARGIGEAYFAWASILLVLLIAERVDGTLEFPYMAGAGLLVLGAGARLGLGAAIGAYFLFAAAALYAGLFGYEHVAGWLASEPRDRSFHAFAGVALIFAGERLLAWPRVALLARPQIVAIFRLAASFLGAILLALVLRMRFA
ncbi:MAG: DUF2339 domain-containing protein, partial [Planctomycetes bacterium]|nr:DUF2339 domain-containing protein [Planctomycetota bacterium]